MIVTAILLLLALLYNKASLNQWHKTITICLCPWILCVRKSEKAQRGWPFSTPRYLEPHLERLKWPGSGISGAEGCTYKIPSLLEMAGDRKENGGCQRLVRGEEWKVTVSQVQSFHLRRCKSSGIGCHNGHTQWKCI